MAIAADTIEILNGLDHEQDITTSILYGVDSQYGTAVSTTEVSIPDADTKVNVIFNNDYDLDGSTVFVRVRLKTNRPSEESILDWVEIPGGGSEGHIIQTGPFDTPIDVASTLHIDVCLSSTTAHTGTEVIIQTGSEIKVNGSWTDLTRYVACVATAISAALTATEPIGETVLAIANPVANNFDTDGKNLFLENTVAADCEIVYQTEHGADS